MPARLLRVQFVEFDEDARFDDVAELVVDAGAERLHGRRQIHIGIDQRRDVDAHFLDLPLEDFIVFPEVFFRQDVVEFARQFDLDGLFGNHHPVQPVHQVILPGPEVLAQEVQDHLQAFFREGRVDGHLAEEILHPAFVEHDQTAQPVEEVVSCPVRNSGIPGG